MSTTRDSFCVLAWMHLASNSSGNLRLCCNSTPTKNLILNDEGRPQRLDHSLNSLQTVYNTKWIREIRQSMLKNESISICQRCYTEEDAGVKSARISWNKKYQHLIEKFRAETGAEGQTDFRPIYVDLRMGNLCNLKCRMCNPYASRKWLEDWNAVFSENQIEQSEVQRLSNMDWFKAENFLKNLIPVLETVEEIYFTGGEPMLITRHFELLEEIVKIGKASKVTIKYNTNMTYLPERALDIWRHFKSVILNTSIDGVGLVNDYIRHPSKWMEIENNLRRAAQFMRNNPNITGSIHTTVQMVNAEHLTGLFEFVRGLGGFRSFPYLNILNHPAELNIRNLPDNFKRSLKADLSAWIESHSHLYGDEPQFQKLKGVIDYMMGAPVASVSQFMNFTHELDLKRGENIFPVSPKLVGSIQDSLSLSEANI